MRRQPADTKFKANRSSHSIKMKKSEKSITTGQEPYSWKHMNSRTPRRSCRDMSRTWEVFVGHLLFCTRKKDPGLGSIRRSPAILHKKKGPRALTNLRSFFHLRNCSFSQPFSRSLLTEPFFSQLFHITRMRRSLFKIRKIPGSFFHCKMIDCKRSDKNDQRHRRG